MDPNWTTIELKPSSNIQSARYDAERAVVRVEFKGGAEYDYFGVAEHVVDDWKKAPSTGKFLNAVLKVEATFPCRRVRRG